ncbi:MAG: PEP-CTERM sorting domain-containing protein [Bryobacterales bacterium]|nr:PEP-CTERM sorting domain-containing protein [Bryobacterales bacterium]
MKRNWLSTALLALGLVTADAARAAIVYENATDDTFVSFIYSALPATQIGDQVQLDGTARLATRASVQFFNNGLAGEFSATLNFFETGAPVGAPLGSFVVDNIALAELGVITVDFTNLNLLVPTDLIFTVAVSNVGSGMDLGLNVFNPLGPTAGASNSSRIIVENGSFSEGITAPGEGNLYFVLEANDAVPEPGSLLMLSGGAAALFLLRRRM